MEISPQTALYKRIPQTSFKQLLNTPGPILTEQLSHTCMISMMEEMQNIARMEWKGLTKAQDKELSTHVLQVAMRNWSDRSREGPFFVLGPRKLKPNEQVNTEFKFRFGKTIREVRFELDCNGHCVTLHPGCTHYHGYIPLSLAIALSRGHFHKNLSYSVIRTVERKVYEFLAPNLYCTDDFSRPLVRRVADKIIDFYRYTNPDLVDGIEFTIGYIDPLNVLKFGCIDLVDEAPPELEWTANYVPLSCRLYHMVEIWELPKVERDGVCPYCSCFVPLDGDVIVPSSGRSFVMGIQEEPVLAEEMLASRFERLMDARNAN